MKADYSIELYILLKIKGRYNHPRKEKMIYRRLNELVIYDHDSMIYQCKNNGMIDSRGEYNKNCGFQHRDLFLTPYGEKRLNQLEIEYMNMWKNRILSRLGWILGVVASIVTILSFLIDWS